MGKIKKEIRVKVKDIKGRHEINHNTKGKHKRLKSNKNTN